MIGWLGGEIKATSLRGMITDRLDAFMREFRDAQPVGDRVNTGENNQETEGRRERVVPAHRYVMHYYDGKFNRLPKSWRVPRLGVKDV